MHIPNEMLGGAVCPVSAALAVAGIVVAGRAAVSSASKPGALRFAAVSALVFAGQMINFPVMDGTSGHLLGGVLASALLGVPFGVLALALVLGVQALVFADGGLLVLGANVFNMALLGAGAGGLINNMFRKQGMNGYLALMLSSWLSIVLASLACSVELAAAGSIAADKVLPAMLGVHALIGIGEALVTLALVASFADRPAARGTWKVAAPLLVAVLIAGLLSPFASAYPDGLEWVAGQLGFLKESAPLFVTPLADYAVAGVDNAALSTALAGVIGVALVAGVAGLLGRLLRSPSAAR